MVDKIIHNLKIITIMKSSGKSDAEIASYLGMKPIRMLELIQGDEFLKNKWEKASESVASEIEIKFLENVMLQLESGDNTDAKWYLERATRKYAKKEQVELSVKSIDDIIREKDS